MREEARLVASHTRIQARSGPLPSPEDFERYEEILPAAERILRMAEEQSKHRQTLEQKVIDGDIAAQRLGLIVGGVVALSLGVVAAVVAIWAQPAAGAVIASMDVAGIVGAFVYGRRARTEELREKR
ncbi:MAG: DUF2335 domain-containing protein [Hyphomicrobiales bacterium]